MPMLNGYQFIKRIKHDCCTKNIPVIFISAETSEKFIKQSSKIGVEDYITKPFLQDELLNMINLKLKSLENNKTTTNQILNKNYNLIQEKYNINKEINNLGYNSLYKLDAKNSKYYQKIKKKQKTNKTNKYQEINTFAIIEKNAKREMENVGRLNDLNLYLSKSKINFDDFYLRKIVKKLIRNAIMFSSKGEKINIKSKIKDNKFHLYVENEGFWNFLLNSARKTKKQSKIGKSIQLSVVESIIRLFKGKFKINNNPTKHFSVLVSLNI